MPKRRSSIVAGLLEKIKEQQEDLIQMRRDFNDLVNYLEIEKEQEVPDYEGSYGIYLGYCVDTLDIYKQNRIRYFCPLFHRVDVPVSTLPFAYPISSFGGIDDCGANWVPPAGSTVAIAFEGGNRRCPYYLGTTWTRLNGDVAQGSFYSVPMVEYEFLYQGRRNGYLCGPNDGTQLLPPWNTESYNGYDITSINDINNSPYLLQKMTFPNIYGFKTPQKHMFKMVDGDGKCNRKWKRLEIMSGCGNWMIFKDDHMHYCGQWAHPVCGAKAGDTSCIPNSPNPPAQVTIDANGNLVTNPQPVSIFNGPPVNPDAQFDFSLQGLTIPPSETTACDGNVIGGSPDYPGKDTQVGANPFFKQQSECRPYKGPQTPQNNNCDLPQTGIQFLSISGHSFVMDDSVEKPEGSMDWERSTQPFSFGCTNKYLGRTYWKSATGHSITLDDSELMGGATETRGPNNGIKLLSALGNQIFLSDSCEGPSCPSLASQTQGIDMISTSGHRITLSDNQNDRQIPCRKEIGAPTPQPNAKNAYVRMRSGYGFALTMFDGSSQTKATDDKFLELSAPQIENGKNAGDHIFRMQVSEQQNGFVYLRAGGDYRIDTFGGYSEVIGIPDDDNSVGNRVSVVKNGNYEITNQTKYIGSNLIVSIAKTQALHLAGQDYEQQVDPEVLKAEEEARAAGAEIPPREKVPNVCPVLVFDGNRGAVVLSDRMFASASPEAPVANILNFVPFAAFTEPNQRQEVKDAVSTLINNG